MQDAASYSFWLANEIDDLMPARGITLGLALSAFIWTCVLTLMLP